MEVDFRGVFGGWAACTRWLSRAHKFISNAKVCVNGHQTQRRTTSEKKFMQDAIGIHFT